MRFCTVALFAARLVNVAAKRCSTRDVDQTILRNGSVLTLNGTPWKAVGANVYWLGLDENVVPPAGEPYYAPSHASYPTKGRITEAMAMVKALGGTMIRAHTLGVSTGNALSVMPTLGEINEQAFDSIDWAVYQARQYGLRLLVPLTDNYVHTIVHEGEGGKKQDLEADMQYRITITAENTTFCVGTASILHKVLTPIIPRSSNFTPMPRSLLRSRTTSKGSSLTSINIRTSHMPMTQPSSPTSRAMSLLAQSGATVRHILSLINDFLVLAAKSLRSLPLMLL
jgi:hypothetical protein